MTLFNRAVFYLLLTQKKNSVRQIISGLRRPKKLLGLLFWVVMVAGLLYSQLAARGSGEALGVGDPTVASGARPLSVLLSFLLLAAAFGGLMQRGLTFHAADIDFLFPGPFHRRALVLYRLLSLYPITLLSTLFLMVFLGPRLASPWLGLVGVMLCQVIALHLQTISSILASTISEKTFGRMRIWVQVVLLVLVGGGVFITITAFAGKGGMGRLIREGFDNEWLRLLFYPATAAGKMSQAPGVIEALPALLGLLLAWGLSLAVVLGLQINFFEASIESSQRFASVVSRVRRGVPVRAARPGDRVRNIHLPFLRLFRGAGAVLWKNLLNAGRSLRVIFFGVVMTAVFSTLAISFAEGLAGGGDQALLNILIIGGGLPFVLQQHVAFDFRRDIDCIAELKLLPARPMAIAAAEVAVPTLIALFYQEVLFLAAGRFLDLPAWSYAAPLLLYPPVTLAICTVTNIGFLIYPLKAVTASGRPNASGATLSALVNMLVLVVCLIPAITVGLVVYFTTRSTRLALLLAVLVQVLVDLGMLWMLGRLFRGFDVARDL